MTWDMPSLQLTICPKIVLSMEDLWIVTLKMPKRVKPIVYFFF